MKTSARLLLVSILGVVLVAPPSYPQRVDERTLINNLTKDVLDVQFTLKQMQASSEQKNAEMTKLMQNLLQEVLTRFGTIDASVKRLNESFGQAQMGLKANDEKSAKDLQQTRTALEALTKNMEEGFLAVQNQFRGVTQKLNDLKSVEQQLPSAGQVFSQGFSDYNSGNYDLAIGGLTEFLRNYPNEERAAAASFYIGEALIAQKKLDEAAAQFDLVLSMYPNSDKKCVALYRKGQILAQQKQIPQARTALDNVVKECPGTQEAANAATDLKSLAKQK